MDRNKSNIKEERDEKYVGNTHIPRKKAKKERRLVMREDGEGGMEGGRREPVLLIPSLALLPSLSLPAASFLHPFLPGSLPPFHFCTSPSYFSLILFLFYYLFFVFPFFTSYSLCSLLTFFTYLAYISSKIRVHTFNTSQSISMNLNFT